MRLLLVQLSRQSRIVSHTPTTMWTDYHLAHPKIRKCNRSRYQDFEPLILADHQVIPETAKRHLLKKDV